MSITTMPAAHRVSLQAARQKYPHQSVPSPCVGVCKIDQAKGWCSGCYRSLDEIAGWSRLPDHDKRRLWVLVEARQAACLEGAIGLPGSQP